MFRGTRMIVPLLVVTLVTGVLAATAVADHGDIHARCDGDKPVITSRPPGTEYIEVVCVDGIPEFIVNPEPIPIYDPITEEFPRTPPPDFGGWVTVWLNGRPLKAPFDTVRRVQEPDAYLTASTSRVMVPIRFFTEAFGGEVEWHQADQRVRMSMPDRNAVIQVWVGRQQATVNGKNVTLDQPPVVFQDRVFVPIRFLSEGLGGKVTWDDPNQSVRVELQGASCKNSTYCGEVR